jgi:hypothetical protein
MSTSSIWTWGWVAFFLGAAVEPSVLGCGARSTPLAVPPTPDFVQETEQTEKRIQENLTSMQKVLDAIQGLQTNDAGVSAP